ncbi:MAG: efflux RND transporter permease subunit [Cellvibrionaceae bacterium]
MRNSIPWFIHNPIAANLLMALILIGGYFSLNTIGREVFPSITTDVIHIGVPYPGAGPREVEEQICIRIEEVISDLEGIKQVTSKAQQNYASISVEVLQDYDRRVLMDDINARIDTIDTFPGDVERPIVSEQLQRRRLLAVAVSGTIGEHMLKDVAERVRDDIALLPGISLVEMDAVRPAEMAVELSEQAMRRFGLSFDDVAKAIRGESFNLPAGVIRSGSGDIQLQSRGQGYTESDFERIAIRSRTDGGSVDVGDVARVTDGFEEQNQVAEFNGRPAVYLKVNVGENPNVVEASKVVNEYIERVNPTLPGDIQLTVWRDNSRLFKGRMELMLKNAVGGLCLVFLLLMMFLQPRVALWVCVGIATAFLGALWVIPYFGVSLNMISMFAFIVILGIVVDDAIIVGESIHARHAEGMEGRAAAAAGARLVAKPVFFAVLTTVIFFSVMLFLPTTVAKIAYPIPVIVIACLFFSLLESLWILPCHLSNLPPEKPVQASDSRFARVRAKVADSLIYFADNYYQPFLRKALSNYSLAIAVFVVLFFFSAAIYVGGWVRTSFMPTVPSDYASAQVTLPEGSPFADTQEVLQKVQSAALALQEQADLKAMNNDKAFIKNIQTWGNENSIWVWIELYGSEQRDVSIRKVANRWKELVGDLPDVEEFKIGFTINHRGDPIKLRLTRRGGSIDELNEATDAVKLLLGRYPGVFGVRDSLQSARPEIEIRRKPYAESLGISLREIARQVRQGFYGEEVQRIPREKEDVKVMVRYTADERSQVEQLRDFRVRSADGREIPLDTLAEVEFVQGYSTIDRIDRQRSVLISADVRAGQAVPDEVVADILKNQLAQLKRDYPGMELGLDGEMRDQGEFGRAMKRYFLLSLLVIFALMAVAFQSYWQPFLILSAVPFGFLGAIVGHVLFGREVSMMSIIGFIACAGVVVNDNLVLLDRINQLRDRGMALVDALMQAGHDRFRPILLTSMTTFVGLTPIMLERSVQAQFLVPMVLSLAFGVLLATVVTLVFVPCLYMAFSRAGEKLSGAISGLRSSPSV